MANGRQPTRGRLAGRRARRARAFIVAAALLSVAVLLPSPLSSRADEEPEVPAISAYSAVVLSDFNQVYYGLNEHERLPMASTTKMMTAIVAVRYGDLDMEVTVAESDLVGESTMGLEAGETLTLHDLLYGLLLPSGNDAAMAIARSLGWREDTQTDEEAVQNFVDMMNATALEFGLQDTHYVNPHGLDADHHYSSAFDLAIILRAALREPVIREIMETSSINASGHDLYNGDHLMEVRGDILGGKTGFTDNAGFCLAGAAKEGDRFVIAVVMDDDGDNWVTDTSDLLDWGLAMTDYRAIPQFVDPRLIGTQFNQTPWMLNPKPVINH